MNCRSGSSCPFGPPAFPRCATPFAKHLITHLLCSVRSSCNRRDPGAAWCATNPTWRAQQCSCFCWWLVHQHSRWCSRACQRPGRPPRKVSGAHGTAPAGGSRGRRAEAAAIIVNMDYGYDYAPQPASAPVESDQLWTGASSGASARCYWQCTRVQQAAITRWGAGETPPFDT